MVSNQEDFTTPTEDISQMQKPRRQFLQQTELTAMWQFTSGIFR